MIPTVVIMHTRRLNLSLSDLMAAVLALCCVPYNTIINNNDETTMTMTRRVHQP